MIETVELSPTGRSSVGRTCRPSRVRSFRQRHWNLVQAAALALKEEHDPWSAERYTGESLRFTVAFLSVHSCDLPI
jgi:hypothetical protein